MMGVAAMMEKRPTTGRRLLAAMSAVGGAVIVGGLYLAVTGHPWAAVIGLKGLMISLGGLMFAVAGAVWLIRATEDADRDFRPPPGLYGEYDRFRPQDSNRSRW